MPSRRQRPLVAISLVLCLAAAGAGASADVPAGPSADARLALQWVLERDDHRQRPFAIVDKKAARIHVYAASGAPLGDAPVLLGATPGDSGLDAPLGTRDPRRLTAAERTTPAGRFEAQPGRNLQGEAIVWLDYGAALAIHRLRPAPAHQQRELRMRSARVDDHRISLGCVVVPVAFYEQVVAPTLGRQPAVVYILPESRSVTSMFASAAADEP
jgi:hypothetical protein